MLRLVAEGLSNREIAQRLFISLSTVKVHNATIYDKLAVNYRTQAVARARSLGCLKNAVQLEFDPQRASSSRSLRHNPVYTLWLM